MISLEKLKPVLEGYKEYFPLHFNGEKSKEIYKWEAVQHFQKHWDIEAENFGQMFKEATRRTSSLLSSGYAYPRDMIINFAKADDNATRGMFRSLFDETIDLASRVEAFQDTAEQLRQQYDDGTWKNHYQNTNAISTYLWLRYPDKYYIYKYELYRAVAKELSSDYKPRRNGSVDSMIGGYRMYDEICTVIQGDAAIRELLQHALTSSCYPDPAFRTATIDVGFYLTRFYLNERKVVTEADKWFPKSADYTPGLSTDDWTELLSDRSVFTTGSLQIMKRMKDYGGQATCTQLSIKYGESANFYNCGSSALARRVAKKTGCKVSQRDNGNERWWSVLYLGRSAGSDDDGSYIWKLRDELSAALDRVDLSDVELYAHPHESDAHGYWWFTANPKIGSFASLQIGEEQNYTLYNENGNKRRLSQCRRTYILSV